MTLEQNTDREKNNKMLVEAAKIAVSNGNVATSLLQRKMKIGYGQTYKIIDRLLELKYISPSQPAMPKETIVTAEQLQKDIENGIVVMGDEKQG